jgi:hypothetical protein
MNSSASGAFWISASSDSCEPPGDCHCVLQHGIDWYWSTYIHAAMHNNVYMFCLEWTNLNENFNKEASRNQAQILHKVLDWLLCLMESWLIPSLFLKEFHLIAYWNRHTFCRVWLGDSRWMPHGIVTWAATISRTSDWRCCRRTFVTFAHCETWKSLKVQTLPR